MRRDRSERSSRSTRREENQEDGSGEPSDSCPTRNRRKRDEELEVEEAELSESEDAEEDRESEEYDYDSDIEINPQFLDAEWLDQARRYMKYARAAAKANKRARQAEERVKTIRSELVNKAKQTDAGKNASTLEAYYRTNPAYKKAKQAWIDAQFEADLLNGAVFGFQNRKAALENLVKLHGQEYFSTPSEPRDLPESAERFNELKQRTARSKIKDKLSRR